MVDVVWTINIPFFGFENVFRALTLNKFVTVSEHWAS